MKRKKPMLVILFCMTGLMHACAQYIAGPDTTICQGAGVVLGSDLAPDNYCYNWVPTSGLSDPTLKMPTAHPDQTTLYTLVGIGPGFSQKIIDEVLVTVSTGGVVMIPSYTYPNGEMNQAVAQMTSVPPGEMITWKIMGDHHGCVINATTGAISACNEEGDVQIRGEITGSPECFAEGTFKINQGVKEVQAIDLDHPTRFAITGDTLHLVGHNSVTFKAIPNDGEVFESDQPDWSEGHVLPPAPHLAEWDHHTGLPLIMMVNAGNKRVYVKRNQVLESSLGSIGHSLHTLYTMLKDFVKPSASLQKNYRFDDVQTPVCRPIEMMFNHNLSYKEVLVEAFNSPALGNKYTIEGEINANVTGKICFPPPYSSVPNPIFVWSTYVFASGSTKLTAGLTKDESIASPASWSVDALNFSGEIKFGVSGEVGMFLPGDVFGSTVSLAGETIIGLDPDLSAHGINAKVKIEPLVIEGVIKVWYLNPDNKIIDVSGKMNLLDPFEPAPFNIITFP